MKQQYEFADGSTHAFTFGDGDAVITYKERDSFMCFNTNAYWWCYYDPKTNNLYDQFCRLLREDGNEYLVRIGLMDSKGKMINYFEE